MEPEVKDNCEEIIMKYYIEKKGMKLIDFTRNDVKKCKSFDKSEIPTIDMKTTMNIEDILKKAPGYDTPLKIDETFVIEMTFEKKNGETKLIDFKRRELQENETDKYPTITFDENENPTNTTDILFKNTKKYKKYLKLFEKTNQYIIDNALKDASTIDYLKSIKSTYYTKDDVINQIYWKMKKIVDDPILQKYKLIIESIRDFIENYEILEKENKQLEKQKDHIGYILNNEISYNKYKTELQDRLEKEKQNRIDKLKEIYEDVKDVEDLPLFTQLIAEINTNMGKDYTEWYSRWYLRFHDKNTLKQGIKTLSQNFMTSPSSANSPPPPPPRRNDS